MRDIAGVFFQRVEAGLGIGGGDLAALTDLRQGFFQRLGIGTRVPQQPPGWGVGCRQGEQQPVLRDIFIAGLLRIALRVIQHTDEFGCHVGVPGASALHFRDAGDFEIHRRLGGNGIAPGGLDQAGGRAFRVVQHRLQQMLGRDALVEFADGDRARGLDKSPRALGQFFNVHVLVPLS